jgi:hypothetical protein
MKPRHTRKQRGGFGTDANRTRIRTFLASVPDTKQIRHCVSQLKRFAQCFEKGDEGRLLQFGYNLGRLQELCHETRFPSLWWNPIEAMVKEKNWSALLTHIDAMKESMGIEYDGNETKGC